MSGLHRKWAQSIQEMQYYRHPIWAQGEMTHLLAEPRPKREENKDKPNHLISAKYPHRFTQEDQRRWPTEDCPIRNDWWCLAQSSPNFVGCFIPPIKRWLNVYHRGICTEDGSLLKIGRNQGNMPWDYSSSPPIKGGHPPPHLETHMKEKSTRARAIPFHGFRS
jgi:hypothetical protein